MTRQIHDVRNEVDYIRGTYVVVSAHGLKNEGYYTCSKLFSAQCLKKEINYMRLFFHKCRSGIKELGAWHLVNKFVSNFEP